MIAVSARNFYPRPPRGGRPLSGRLPSPCPPYFYPRPPRGGRPGMVVIGLSQLKNFYPRPPRGGRPAGLNDDVAGIGISTHALREEGDQSLPGPPAGAGAFLPTPSARRATELFLADQRAEQFLPTPSARRATKDRRRFPGGAAISTHALREEGDLELFQRLFVALFISTHALREEGDIFLPFFKKRTKIFLPTPSARRATESREGWCPHLAISTHALREEGDPSTSSTG